MSVGLVLGAGGLVGQAYHAGVLAALEWDLGWDPSGADMIVGTSAGSLTAGTISLGVPSLDYALWSQSERWEEDGPLLHSLDGIRHNLPDVDLRMLCSRWQLPEFSILRQGIRRPWKFNALLAACSMLPSSRPSLIDLAGQHLSSWKGQPLPKNLLICATRRRDGKRVVFGDDPELPDDLPAAIAASSSIPGYVAPATLDGVSYIDGGLISPTNADVLVGDVPDVVVIISPMSGRAHVGTKAANAFARRRLQFESRMLEHAGAVVLCFEPSVATARAMGRNPMAQTRSRAVVREAFFETGRRMLSSCLRDLLTGNSHS